MDGLSRVDYEVMYPESTGLGSSVAPGTAQLPQG